MSRRTRSRNVRRIYQFIKENDREHSVGTMCRLLGKLVLINPSNR